jgi:hypothetical protein
MQPQASSSKKSIIILIAILVIGGGIYFYMSGTPTDNTSLSVDGTTSDAGVIGAQVLSLLNQVNSLKIEGEFFKTPAYKSLIDHTVPIFEQNVGKQNPFLDPHPPKAATPAH